MALEVFDIFLKVFGKYSFGQLALGWLDAYWLMSKTNIIFTLAEYLLM